VASWRQGGRLTAVAGAVTLLVGCAPEAAPLLREDLDRLRADLLRVEQEVQGSRSALLTEIQATDRRTAQTLTELLADQFPSTEEAAKVKDELARIRKR
jgi:hypothetical protein